MPGNMQPQNNQYQNMYETQSYGNMNNPQAL